MQTWMLGQRRLREIGGKKKAQESLQDHRGKEKGEDLEEDKTQEITVKTVPFP
jgi:hypothetical protein